ncbi:MAG: hypothetical protein ACOY0T_05910 [Myxococcota bacterium]
MRFERLGSLGRGGLMLSLLLAGCSGGNEAGSNPRVVDPQLLADDWYTACPSERLTNRVFVKGLDALQSQLREAM